MMKHILAALGSLMFLLPAAIFAVEAEKLQVVAAMTPRNGVFVTYTGDMTILIELKDGKFRYWFESDLKEPHEPIYPLSGNYTVDGNRIVLVHPKIYPHSAGYTFRSVDGKPTLWRDDAMKMEAEGKTVCGPGWNPFSAGSILSLSPRSAEESWEKKIIPRR